jgi:hypothetical protein
MRRIAVGFGLLLAFSAIVSACTSSDSDGPVEGTISVSERLSFNSDEVLVEFVEVTSDSRCPAEVQCVWAGEASVAIKTTAPSVAGQVSTHKMGPGESVSIQQSAYTITLLELSPDPPPVGGVEQSDYKLHLRIEKR